MKHKKWSFKDERQLAILYAEGYKAAEIAEILGRTPGAVYAKTREIRDIYAPLFSGVIAATPEETTPAIETVAPAVEKAATSRDRFFGATLFGVLCALSGAAIAAGLM